MSNNTPWPAAILLGLSLTAGLVGCEDEAPPTPPAPVAASPAPASPTPTPTPAQTTEQKNAAVAVSVDDKGGSVEVTTKGGDKVSIEASTDSKK